MGPEEFRYDNRSLQQAILKEMERNEWVGVCCEPNLVFVVCNQFPVSPIYSNSKRLLAFVLLRQLILLFRSLPCAITMCGMGQLWLKESLRDTVQQWRKKQ
jgi:hypothetical protein